MKEGVVLYLDVLMFVYNCVIIESQVDFYFLPTTNIFVAFITNFFANQNPMRCVGVDLTIGVYSNEKSLSILPRSYFVK